MEDPATLLIQSIEAFGPISLQDKDIIRELAIKTRVVLAGDHAIREGDHSEICAIILSGFAVGYKCTASGSRQIVSLVIPGELSGLQSLFLHLADTSVQALTRSNFAILPRNILRMLIGSNLAIGRAAFASIAVESAISRVWLMNLGRKDARERMAHFLCELSVRLPRASSGPNVRFEIPLTQEQLGDALGMTPVHVNRTFRILQDEGLILRVNRSLEIRRWNDLCTVGGFVQRYLYATSLTGAPT